MEFDSLKQLKHPHICEICLRHDPLVKDYAEDQELQHSIRSYIAKETGDSVSLSEIGKMCDSCYFRVNEATGQQAEPASA